MAFSNNNTDYEPHDKMKPPDVHEKQYPKHGIEEEVEWSFRKDMLKDVATGVKYFNWVDVQTKIKPKTRYFK